MIHRRVRPALLVFALSLLLGSWLASIASATVTSSSIVSPADSSLLPLLVEPLEASSKQSLTVSGTTDGSTSDEVELGCFYINPEGTAQEQIVKDLANNPVKLKVQPDGSFSTAELSGTEAIALSSLRIKQPCTLRAVPVGTAATANVEAFAGARLGDAGISVQGESESELFDDFLNTTTFEGNWEWDSAGSCGPYGAVYDPATLQRSAVLVADCEADLYRDNETGSAPAIVIDTHSAYDVNSAQGLNAGASGQPFLRLSPPSYDQATGDLSQTETEALVYCESSGGTIVDKRDPSKSECEKFAPSGVKLVRTVATSKDGLEARVTDRFESTDGLSHKISLSYGEEQAEGGPNDASFKFPGESTFATHSTGDTPPVGSGGPETIYYQTNAAAAEPENGLENPRGAITLSSAPDVARFVGQEDFELVYSNRTVPASGALTLVHSLSQSLSQSGVEALANEAQEQLAGPALTIDSPPSTTTVFTPIVQISGTASAKLGVSSLTVNGVGVSVGEGGKWSTNVHLNAGANTISATVTDQGGRTKSASISVTYQPLVIPPPPPIARAVKVGAVSGANGRATFTISCVGPAGSVCKVKATLTTIEKLKGKRLRGVAARSKQVTIGSVTLSIRAGTRVRISIGLNALGRKLLAHFRKLPAHISVLYTSNSNSAKNSALSQNLTIKPRKHSKHKH